MNPATMTGSPFIWHRSKSELPRVTGSVLRSPRVSPAQSAVWQLDGQAYVPTTRWLSTCFLAAGPLDLANMQAVARADLKHPDAIACCLFLESLVQEQLAAAQPNLAKLSIALGAVEDSLTSRKNAEQWPQQLPQLVEHNLAVVDSWIATLAGKLETLDSTRVSCSSHLH